MRIKKNKQVIAGAIACALLVSGTLAWQSFSQIATNETNGIEADQGTRLHNYFDGSNADVFVENYARFETGATAYTRVKVLEYMEIGDTAGALTGRNESAITQVRGDVENTATPDINDKTTWDTYLHDSNEDATGEIRDYMSVSYGDAANANKGQAVYMPTFNKDFENLDPDIIGKVEGNTGDRFTTDQYNDYDTYSIGETVTAHATYSADSSVAQAEGSTSVEETHEAVNTLSGSVITMDEWISDGKNTGNFWVYDVDGWAYWANGLAPETATSVLIDNVSRVKTPDTDWYYGLHVINDSATANGWLEEMGTTGNDISDNALLLLEELGMEAEVFSISIRTASGATPSATYRETTVGESIELSAVVVASSTAAYYQDVQWSIDYPQGSLTDEEYAEIFNEGTFTPVVGMEGNTYTVTVTSVADPTIDASVELSVIDLTADPTLEINNVYIRTSTGNIPSASYKETAVGGAISLKAEVATSFGNDVYQNVKWEISGNSVSSDVLVEGVFIPVAGMEGKTYTVTATSLYDDTKSDTLTLTVSNVVYTIDSVNITNASGGVPSSADKETSVGDSTTFAAAVYSSLGYETFQDMTWTVSSASTNLTTAVLNTTISNGVFTPVEGMEGRTYTITATSKVDTSKSDSVEVNILDLTDASEYEITSMLIVDIDGKNLSTGQRQTAVGDSLSFSVKIEASDSRDPQVVWSITSSETNLDQEQLNKTISNGVFTPVEGMEGKSYSIIVSSLLSTKVASTNVTVSELTEEEISNASIELKFYADFTNSSKVEQGEQATFQAVAAGLTSSYVDWVIEGNDSPDTYVAQMGLHTWYTGKLVIGVDEPVGNILKVTAVAAESSKVVSNPIEVEVIEIGGQKTIVEIPGAIGSAVVGGGGTVEIDGVNFYVLALNETKDAVLLWPDERVSLADGSRSFMFHDTNISTWSSSYVRNTVIPAWLDIMPTVAAKALTVETSTDTYTAVGVATTEVLNENIFLLSKDEFDEYVGLGDSRATSTHQMWLRSSTVVNKVAYIDPTALTQGTSDASSMFGVRPAFWLPL